MKFEKCPVCGGELVEKEVTIAVFIRGEVLRNPVS
jgi:hypothetical protein